MQANANTERRSTRTRNDRRAKLARDDRPTTTIQSTNGDDGQQQDPGSPQAAADGPQNGNGDDSQQQDAGSQQTAPDGPQTGDGDDGQQQDGDSPQTAPDGPQDDTGNTDPNADEDKQGNDGEHDDEDGEEPAPLPGPLAAAVAEMRKQRDELRAEVDGARAALEVELAPKVAQLAEMEGYIAAIERQHGTAGNGNGNGGTHAPRGRNWEKIAPHLRDGRPKTSAELMQLTGIGRGSLDRTLNARKERGEVTKTNSGWVIAAAK